MQKVATDILKHTALRAQLCLNMLSRQLTRFWNRAGVCVYDNSSYGFLIIGVSHIYFIGPTGKSDSGKYSKHIIGWSRKCMEMGRSKGK